MFAVLTYTDCAADDSVSGRSGFQFQAESPGATPTDEDRISSGLLHVVPLSLDPAMPETHPPTCAYAVFAGRYYLSRGRSTGRTLSGRPGNQLTQTIVTDSSADVLPLRPAQLFSAASWSLEPAAERVIPGWEAPLEIDPAFETAALHEMVTSDPWSRELLPAFLTMAEQATATPRVKLIIAHPDQAVVMRWVALASLLQDGSRAMEMTFRVFSANPMSETAHVVGAHPSLSPELSPERAAGCNLVDLERRRSTPLSVSPSAAMHASWFTEHEPYAALDAVETSRRWAGLFDPAVAAAAASVACLDPDPADLDASVTAAALTALSALARGGHRDELEAYGEAIVDAIVTRPPRAGEDITHLAAAMWDLDAAGEHALSTGLALAGLEWAVQDPEAARAWARSHSLPTAASQERRLRWADAEAAAHGADLVGRVFSAAPDDELPAWFSLAKALGTAPTVEQADAHIGRLARRWAADPRLTAVAFTWVHGDQMVGRLEGELHGRLEAGDPTVLHDLAEGRWDWLTGGHFRVDPGRRPLSTWLAARVLDAQPPEARVRLIEEVAPLLPGWASVLFLERRRERVHPDEIAAWLVAQRQLSTGLAALIQDQVQAHLKAQRLGPFLRIVGALRDNDVTGLSPVLETVLSDEGRMRAALTRGRQSGSRGVNSGLLDVAAFPRAWHLLYADHIAERLLLADDSSAVLAVSGSVGGSLDEALGRVVRRLAERGEPSALIGTLRLGGIDPEGLGRAARRGLAPVWHDAELEPARVRMREHLPATWEPLLKELEAGLAKDRRFWHVLRGGRRTLDTKGRG